MVDQVRSHYVVSVIRADDWPTWLNQGPVGQHVSRWVQTGLHGYSGDLCGHDILHLPGNPALTAVFCSHDVDIGSQMTNRQVKLCLTAK